MNARKGFTKIDTLVTITCLVLLAVNIPVISAGGRGRAKIDVCKANLMQLSAGWHLYADDNGDKIVNAQIWKVHSGWPIPFGETPGGQMYIDGGDSTSLKVYGGQVGWVYWPHRWNTNTLPSDGSISQPHKLGGPAGGITAYAAKEADWQHGIACGGLWKYIKDFRVYKCPVAEKKAYITYNISMMMNGSYCNNWCKLDLLPGGDPLCGTGVTNPPPRNRLTIKNPANRMLFIDTGNVEGGSWDARVAGSTADYFCWLSLPPVRHGKGTTLSFADGHCEYRKWVNPQTLVTQTSPYTGTTTPCPQMCNQDLFYMQKTVCGGLSQAELASIPPGCNIE